MFIFIYSQKYLKRFLMMLPSKGIKNVSYILRHYEIMLHDAVHFFYNDVCTDDRRQCVIGCKRKPNGDYVYCKSCTHYIKCRKGQGILMKLASPNIWNDLIRRCDSSCDGECSAY